MGYIVVRKKSRKLIYGVGVNDSDYVTQPSERNLRCPFFDRWHSMIRRCYSSNSKVLNPSYGNVSVCADWLTYSKFKSWMTSQKWEGLALDKDILGNGNFYSPDTCCFVPQHVNSFFSESTKSDFPGAYLKFKDGRTNPYISQIYTDGLKRHLGVYPSEMAAHRAWQFAKLKELDRLIINNPDLDKRVVMVMNNSRQLLKNAIEAMVSIKVLK